MINKDEILQFEEVFPQSKGITPKSREDSINLAHSVAAALKEEREKLVREHQSNNITTGFFSATS